MKKTKARQIPYYIETDIKDHPYSKEELNFIEKRKAFAELESLRHVKRQADNFFKNKKLYYGKTKVCINMHIHIEETGKRMHLPISVNSLIEDELFKIEKIVNLWELEKYLDSELKKAEKKFKDLNTKE